MENIVYLEAVIATQRSHMATVLELIENDEPIDVIKKYVESCVNEEKMVKMYRTFAKRKYEHLVATHGKGATVYLCHFSDAFPSKDGHEHSFLDVAGHEIGEMQYRCQHWYQCITCGQTYQVDSSD